MSGLSLLVPIAWAHAGALLEGLDHHRTRAGAEAIETSVGLLWKDAGDVDVRWLCHEAVTQPGAVAAPRYAVGADGAVLAIVHALDEARDVGVPVYRTDDRCAWDPVLGLDGAPVIDAAFHPADPAVAFAVSRNAASGSGRVYRSEDGGRSFLRVHEDAARLFRSIQVGADGAVWAAATGEGGGVVHHSADGGETWRALEVPLAEPGADVDVLAAPDGAALLAVGPFLHDRLVRIAPDGATTVLAEPDAELTDVAIDADGAVWATVNGESVRRLREGRLEAVADAPVGQGLGTNGAALVVATRSRLDGRQLVETRDQGRTWRTTFHLSALQPPPDCPAASETAARCDPIWPELEARLPLAPGEAPSDTADAVDVTPRAPGSEAGGCGGGAAGLLLLSALGLRRRRHSQLASAAPGATRVARPRS